MENISNKGKGSSKIGRELLNGCFKFNTECSVVCKYCKQVFKYHKSSSSLAYHLRTKHPYSSPTGFSSPTSSVKVDLTLECTSPLKLNNTISDSSTSPPEDNICKKKQPTLFDMHDASKPVSTMKNLEMTNSIAKWIAMNCRPINIVKDEGLQDLLRIATGSSSYTLPSRPTIDARFNNLYIVEKAKIVNYLKEATYVSLTADYWSSIANMSYLGVTCHFLDKYWHLKSFALNCCSSDERHYSELCAEDFKKVANKWNIQSKVTSFVTDNARNMINAVALTDYEHISCMAHTLQLSVKKALSECGVDTLLAVCRKIVGHFTHSPANTIELNNEQCFIKHKEESLIQDVVTRWNSTLAMIERLLSNKEPIIAVLTNPSHKHSLTLLKGSDWEKLKVIQALLEPSRYATVTLGGEQYVSCSVILPMLCHLFRSYTVNDDDPAYAVRFKTAFTTDLETRRQKCNLKWLNIATALDPRFKLLKCLPKDQREEVWEDLRILMVAAEQNLASTMVEKSPENPLKKCRMMFELSSDSDEEMPESRHQILNATKLSRRSIWTTVHYNGGEAMLMRIK